MRKSKIINVVVPICVTIILCLVSELVAKKLTLEPGEAQFISRTFRDLNDKDAWTFQELDKLKKVDDRHSRVVILGGSSVEKIRIQPEAFTESFGSEVTIVNLGSSAFTSSGVRGNFEKALKYEPDLFVIYSGHNNYWSETEGLTSDTEYLSGVSHFLFEHSNVYRYIFAKRLRSKIGDSVRTTKNPIYSSLNSIYVKNDFIKFGKTFQYGVNDPNVAVVKRQDLAPIIENEKKAVDKFKSDMQFIIKSCRERDIPLIFVTPVSSPDTYDYYLSYIDYPKSLETFSLQYTQAENLFSNGDFFATGVTLQNMELEYPENGLVAAFMATYYGQIENYDKAHLYELKTIELNLRSHRAKEPLEKVVREFEDVNNKVYVLDLESLLFSRENKRRVSDMGLFIDYLHPSLKLYYVLGAELSRLIKNKDILHTRKGSHKYPA